MSAKMPSIAAVVNPIVAIIDKSILFLPDVYITIKEKEPGICLQGAQSLRLLIGGYFFNDS
jgi:hypothetical protein